MTAYSLAAELQRIARQRAIAVAAPAASTADRIRYVLTEHANYDDYGKLAVEVDHRVVDALADIVADEVAAALYDAERP